MRVVVNGETRELPVPSTVTDVLASVGRSGDGRGVAVALNGEVVPTREWPATVLADGDRIEVLGATQGG